ncbi:MAG TPA: dipeptidase [Kofleriaceae bacterium]|nr:dipeptidase [Kofleriaceae bacterium]
MRVVTIAVAALLVAVPTGCKKKDEAAPVQPTSLQPQPVETPEARLARATALAQRFIIVDGHIDLPYRLYGSRDAEGNLTEDVAKRTAKGDFDFERARAGGLDAPFMSIYIPARYQQQGGAKKLADELIDLVEGLAEKHPDQFAMASSPDQVVALHRQGKLALPLGIENGAAIEGDLANLAHFHQRGVRYITLTHSEDNDLCDSSYAETRTHKGLSELGKQVVAEMNRLGIMVDISHVSDESFMQVLELSKVPVIASHSSLRHFVPGFERNVSDDMVKALAKNGGVIMINFGSGFVDAEANAEGAVRRKAVQELVAAHQLDSLNPEHRAKIEAHVKAMGPSKLATVATVADHIMRVIELVGVDHVGLGSDYDGVGPTLPVGLEDASKYPALLSELLARGVSEPDLEKICGTNALRVWRAAEAYAASQRPPE